MKPTDVLIAWTPESNTEIPLLDEQHRGIVSAINSLQHFINAKRGNYHLNATIAMIDSYTKIHFATEENFLHMSGYKAFSEHKAMHEELIKRSFSIAHESMLLHSPQLFLDFLRTWWMNHIQIEDQIHAPHVLEYFNNTKLPRT